MTFLLLASQVLALQISHSLYTHISISAEDCCDPLQVRVHRGVGGPASSLPADWYESLSSHFLLAAVAEPEDPVEWRLLIAVLLLEIGLHSIPRAAEWTNKTLREKTVGILTVHSG